VYSIANKKGMVVISFASPKQLPHLMKQLPHPFKRFLKSKQMMLMMLCLGSTTLLLYPVVGARPLLNYSN